MADTDTVVHNYIAMWNETDPDRRRALVAETVTDDADYVDPVMDGAGVDGITAMIGAAQAQFPGHRFALVSGPEAHHDRARFAWSLAADGGAPVAVGVDFVSLADDGRMRSITGFLEPASAG
ncbi:MAG TPA: nuclear transport factor 2 family protein [Solirubrobacteraceae bacterium]|nr:nuclear transport factor 2 family protein [Solirubrobacteraceae bacterium]